MRTIRRAILAGFAAICIPLAGFNSFTSSAMFAVSNRLLDLAEASARNAARDFVVPGVRIRSEPATSATVQGVGSPGDRVTVHRSVSGEPVPCPNGKPSAEWLHITNRRTSVSGYVSACFV